MNINKLFPSRFVKADDLGGKRITLVIDHVTLEKVRNEDGERQAAVVYFTKAKKGLLLNKTNAMSIAAMYGPETDGWPGHAVTLYATRVKAFGQTVEAVRVDEPPAPAKGNVPVAHDAVPDAMNEDVPDEEEIDLNLAAGFAA